MDLTSFRMLLSPSGQAVLQAAVELQPDKANFLKDFNALNRNYPHELARAALEIAILRREAAAKFPMADKLYFTRQALEQSSSFPVSTYRARRFRPFKVLADLGCSIGADTLALAGEAPVLGFDIEPLRLAMAQANLATLGLSKRACFIHADLNQALPLPPNPDLGLFFDPARRSESRRIYSVREYLPPLAIVKVWLADFPAVGVKISPGVKLDELAEYDAELEFISLDRELKEAVLWFGALKTCARRATVLPGPFTLTEDSVEIGQPVGKATRRIPLLDPQSYIYEPDPAVIRAGLVEKIGEQIRAGLLDVDVAYLTAGQRIETPFARCWEIEDWFPFQLKRLRSILRDRNVGEIVVKKRGSPLNPEQLIRDLRLSGEQRRVVFLTHLRGRPIVILAFNN